MEHQGRSHAEADARRKEEKRLYVWFCIQRAHVKLRRLQLLQKRADEGFFIRLKSEREWTIETRINCVKGEIIKWENLLGIGNAIQQPREELNSEPESVECSALCNVHPSTARTRLARRGFFLAQRDYYGGDALRMCGW